MFPRLTGSTARAACWCEVVATAGKTESDTPSYPSHTDTTSSTGAIIPEQDFDDCYFLGTALPSKLKRKCQHQLINRLALVPYLFGGYIQNRIGRDSLKSLKDANWVLENFIQDQLKSVWHRRYTKVGRTDQNFSPELVDSQKHTRTPKHPGRNGESRMG